MKWVHVYSMTDLQRFPRLPKALEISSGFEFLLDTSLHPRWMMIASGQVFHQ